MRASPSFTRFSYKNLTRNLTSTATHSLGGQLIHWGERSVVAPLVAAGYRVIRFDNRDAGKSTFFHALKPQNMVRRRVRSIVNSVATVRLLSVLYCFHLPVTNAL